MAKRNVQVEVENISPQDATKEFAPISPLGPRRSDPGYSDYLLSLLQPGEYVDDRDEGKRFPKIAGLRRVTQTLGYEILESYPISIVTPDSPYQVWAIVNYRIVLQEVASGKMYICGGLGDVNEDNLSGTDDEREFLKYAVRTAETQAEGRAFRKFHNLNVCTIEELTTRKGNTVLKPAPATGGEPIEPQQVSGINKHCRDLGLKADDYVAEKTSGRVTSVAALNKEQAKVVLSNLGVLIRKQPPVS